MNLIKFVALNEEHTLSPDEVQSLNADLSCRLAVDIAENYRIRVTDYLLVALKMEAVETKLVPDIERLLKDLQSTN